MSINDKFQKIKSFLDSDKGRGFYFIILLVLASSSSFGLGRLSQTSLQDSSVRIIYPDGSDISANAYKAVSNASKQPYEPIGKIADRAGGSYIASKKGKKYYPIDCSAGSSLKEENKIFFNTESEAESAGYTKSASCD